MYKKIAMMAMALIFQVHAGELPVPSCAGDPAPQKAVENFLQAMKTRHFAEAYRFVTRHMTDGRTQTDWASLQEHMFDRGGVVIGAIDVRAAHREMTKKKGCAPRARVPNVLHAGDVLNNQGSTEFEIYDAVLEAGQWKIDAQESLFSDEAIRTWFPDEKAPKLNPTVRPFLPSWIALPKDLGLEPTVHGLVKESGKKEGDLDKRGVPRGTSPSH